ncbi:MAG: AAA family ATPase [Chloroflexi bacterium]|nr:AAA family ATPase [Chloroflexota bacterium]
MPIHESTLDGNPSATGPIADLWIDEVRVANFRSIVDAQIPLEKGTTFLVGENNSGKSSILLAIATACGFHRPMQDDLHRTSDSVADEATIDLVIRSSSQEFSEVVAQRLAGNYGSGPGGGEWTAIRMNLQPSRESAFLSWTRRYMTWDEAEREWQESNLVPSRQMMELVSAHVVEASRDLSSDLARRTSNWGQVLAELGISASDREDLEVRLAELGSSLRQASPTFGALEEELLEMRGAQSSIEQVEIRPLPERIEDLIHSVDVVMGGGNDSASLPIRLQGSGSRSLAALRVYFALCKLRIGVDQGIRPHLVTLLEEPEAHLHPQAQAAVHRSIQSLQGQAVVATHSNVLVGEADLHAIRLIRSAGEGTSVSTLTSETARKVAVFRRFISRPLGELFFARLVILVDGAAERATIPVLLDPLLGRDVSGLGVTLLDMQGQSQEWLRKVIAALEELGGIPWVAFVDNDSDGLNSIKGCVGSDGVPLSEAHPQVVMSGKKQLEQLLLEAGYYQEVEMVANEHASWEPPDPRAGQPRLPKYAPKFESDYLGFLAHTKGWSGELVARAAVSNRRQAPPPIVELANRVRGALSPASPAPMQLGIGVEEE